MLALLTSCRQEGLPGPENRGGDGAVLSHGMIELGEKLDDPYTIGNMRRAVAKVYPTRAREIEIFPTDLYVRFLPRTEQQYARLQEMGLRLTDHPVDYRIVREGDYYHDPSVPEDAITWQYAVVGKEFEFPDDIRYEVLDECYISENDPVTRAESGLDWEAVEREAFQLTGNGDLYASPGTRLEGDVFPT